MFGMNCVGLKPRSVGKGSNETGVERARQFQHIEADRQTLDLRDYRSEGAEHPHVFFTDFLLDVRFVFPNYDVGKHKI